MVGIETADECRRLGEPFLEVGQCFLAESPRLVAYLPRHDSRVVDILDVGVLVGAAQDEPHIVVEQFMRLLVARILRHEVHVGGIAILVGTRGLSRSGMFEVEAIAPTPLPGVVEIEHRHHITLAHLHEQIVESGKDGVVVNAGFHLQGGFHLRGHPSLAIRPHEDAQVVDAHLFHLVELAAQTLTVATLPFRTEYGPIPEVGAHIIIRFSVLDEMSVFHLHESVVALYFASAGTAVENRNKKSQCKQDFFHIVKVMI